MDRNNTRIDAIKALIGDEIQRGEKSSWKEIFESTELSPQINDPSFEKSLLELLQQEESDGYRRKDEILRTKNRRRSNYTPSQMYITSKVGRYIFAVMGWHNSTPREINHQVLVELSEAFNFKIDPKETHLQQVSETERKAILEEEEDREYDARNKAMFIGGIGLIISVIWYMIRRFG